MLSLLVLVGFAGGMAVAQGVQWTLSAPTPSNGGTSSVAFVDQDFIMMQTGRAYGEGQQLQLFAAATQQQLWTLPAACPFPAIPTDPSSTTLGPLSVYHVRRTGAQQLTYLCWSSGQPEGHAVSVSTATGNITAQIAVHSKALAEPSELTAVASAAAGAYCVQAPRDALCVSGQGQVWHLDVGSRYDQTGIYEYNGTLAVQHSWTVRLYNLWTGTLKDTVSRSEGGWPRIVAVDQYLVIAYPEQAPCTLVTLDLLTGTLSGVVTLPGFVTLPGQRTFEHMVFETSAALMDVDGPAQLIVTLPSQPFASLLGWQVPATTPTAVTATQLFNHPLVLSTANGVPAMSWAVSSRYVIVVISLGFETSTSLEVTQVLHVSNGSLVTSFSTGGAPVALTSVSEREGYIAVTGSYLVAKTTFSTGSGVTVLNATTGLPLWTRGNAEIIGPDRMPLDTAAGCIMVAPSQGYTGQQWGTVQCIAV